MGHFGRRPIRVAWFAVAFPSVALSYLGQGAVLLRDAAAAQNPFFRAAPTWSLFPLVAIATAATVIASQALISAVFSLTSQATQLGLCPRPRTVHTSSAEAGQIYLPGLNWLLMLACLALVLGFRSSTRLAAAYGLAVSGTMMITTLLFMVVARNRWKWSVPRIALVAGTFLVIDVAFLGANLLKIPEGGWIPLVIAAIVLTLLTTWRRGRALLRRAAEEQSGSHPGLDAILNSVKHGSAARVRGTAVYLHSLPRGVPRSFLHNLKHNKVVHQHVLFVTITTDEVPLVSDEERVRVTPLTEEKDFWQVTAHYGFMEEPNVPDVLQRAAQQGVTYTAADTSYFLGRETVIPSAKPGMARWREQLFARMMRNAGAAATRFGLTANRVVELGAEVEI
jgi:KUP system potassium uptake protein